MYTHQQSLVSIYVHYGWNFQILSKYYEAFLKGPFKLLYLLHYNPLLTPALVYKLQILGPKLTNFLV